MKRLFVTLGALLLVVLPAKAQIVNFRVEAGASFNVGKMEIANIELNNKTRAGYHFGAYVDIPVYNNFYLGSGLTFAMKGATNTGVNEKNDLNLTLHYLQIPVNVGYKFQLSPSISLALQTGPYFAVALGATSSTKGFDGAKKSYNLFKDGVTNLTKPNRFDMGWGLDARAMYSHYYVFLGADFGFLEVFKDNDGENKGISGVVNSLKPSFKNTLIHVGLGVQF